SPFSIFHPNIQAAKDCNQVRDFITKEVDSDVNTAEWGTFVAVSTPGRKDRDADMASSSTPRFRVYSKYLFLTYPQCTLEPQYALDSLRTLLNKYEPLYIAAVRELHEDGSPHLHVLVQNKLRASITNPNALNLRMDT
uniref:Replication-associated protein n=1 Tax=Wheat dwarf virus TaxID=10834 RepID=UPI001D1A5B8E|nr:Chain A, Replication-associated protein [Wheat dwarf virus]